MALLSLAQASVVVLEEHYQGGEGEVPTRYLLLSFIPLRLAQPRLDLLDLQSVIDFPISEKKARLVQDQIGSIRLSTS